MSFQFPHLVGIASLISLATVACISSDTPVETIPDAPTEVSTAGYGFCQNLALDSFGVVGIAEGADGTLWLSDADNNRLLHLGADLRVMDTLTGFDRPMHLAIQDGQILVAEYGADEVLSVRGAARTTLPKPDAFDAPSGVDADGDRLAVADFYNHRVVYTVGGRDRTFGTKGTGAGEMTYPTDVQFAHGKLWVADAYNHRVQVFDLDGKHLRTIGEAEAMNAATGLFVSEDALYVTDFENSRIQIYDLDGRHLGTLTEGLDKPTDVLAIGDTLYVVNYAGRSLGTYVRS